jgi:hypothetical protein
VISIFFFLILLDKLVIVILLLLLIILLDKISDSNPLIVATAVSVLNDINHKQIVWTVSETHISRLLSSLEDSGYVFKID